MASTIFVTPDVSNDAYFTALHKRVKIFPRFDHDHDTLALMAISARQSIGRAREIEKTASLPWLRTRSVRRARPILIGQWAHDSGHSGL
jgi:hypothetical protein